MMDAERTNSRADKMLLDIANAREERADAEAGRPVEKVRTIRMVFDLPVPAHLAEIVDSIASARGITPSDVLRAFGSAHFEKVLLSILIQLESLGENRN